MATIERKEAKTKRRANSEPSAEPVKNDLDRNHIKNITSRDIHIDQKYEQLVPRSSAEEYEALKESIKKDGQRDPIIVNQEGKILDGHTRFQILKGLNSEPKFEIRPFQDEQSEEDYVIETAVLRRHLNTFQKIELAQSALIKERDQANQRQKQGTSLSSERKVGEAIEIVAKRFGIPRSTFAKGQRILENATLEQVLALERGNATINEIYNKLPNKVKTVGYMQGRDGLGQEQEKEEIVGASQLEGRDKKEGESSLDREVECDGCHITTTRAKLKESKLCENCRRRLSMNW